MLPQWDGGEVILILVLGEICFLQEGLLKEKRKERVEFWAPTPVLCSC